MGACGARAAAVAAEVEGENGRRGEGEIHPQHVLVCLLFPLSPILPFFPHRNQAWVIDERTRTVTRAVCPRIDDAGN
jgi:hypothetical protein